MIMKYPSFKSENEFFKLHAGLSEVDLLEKYCANLKVIHDLTTNTYSDFDSLIKDYLFAGVKIFDMEFGIVSEIIGEDYIVCDAISPDNVLQSGAKFELEGTYCREVVKSQEVIGLPNVGSIEEMKGHPVYVNMKLESYISAPIYFKGVIFGTLNFSSTKVRANGFSEYERELISMLSASIGRFLFLKDKEEKLENANKRIRKLTGYVAHDLRTPLGNILNLAELLPGVKSNEGLEMVGQIKSISKKALKMVDTILEAAIISDGKITLDKRSYDLGEVFRDSIKDLKSFIGENDLILKENFKDTLVYVDKERMLQVFSNLVLNCLKYSQKGSEIKVSIFSDSDGAHFEMENIVKTISNESNTLHGVTQKSIGFGLEITREVLKLHSSELFIEKSGGTYRTSFILN